MAGCAAGAALQMIPAVVQMASGASAIGARAVHGEDKPDQEGEETGGPCDDLKASAPLVVELKTASSDPIRFRKLTLVAPQKKTPYWAPDGEWQAGNQLAQMGFNPPLGNLLPPGPGSYIVYAPSEPRDQREQDQLESLVVAFGAGVGIFQSEERIFDYTIVRQLPCFPSPQ